MTGAVCQPAWTSAYLVCSMSRWLQQQADKHEAPQTSKEALLQQLSSPGERAKALERALRMVSEKRPYCEYHPR